MSIIATSFLLKAEVQEWQKNTKMVNANCIIVSVTVNDCNSVSAHLVYCPSPNNIFHSEINGSPDTILLNDDQCLALSRRAVVVSYEETSVISK